MSEQDTFRDDVGNATKAMRLTSNTRGQYERRLQAFKAWLEENEPECVIDEDEDPECTASCVHSFVLPLPDDVLDKYMAHCLLKVDKNTGQYHDPPQFYSFSHVNTHRSAIQYIYTERKEEMSPRVKLLFKETLDGFKRKVAEMKQRGEISQTEGKQPMTKRGYLYLAKEALTQTEDFNLYMFCHTFLVLCWNLIARAVTVGNIMYDHISWEEDALTINIGKQKNDQEGNHAFPRHVYANPSNPFICPVLSFAILVFSQGYRREGSDRRVFGDPKHSKDRFGKWLGKLLHACAEVITALGVIISAIGTHSFRKGIATALANSPGGPSAVNIWLRAGWSLGQVQSRYIFEGAGGDHFVGRAATCISTSDIEFAALPPHFDETNGPLLTVGEWEDILPGFSTFYPDTFRVALPFLLASLVYHRQWLQDTLPAAHPLFKQRVWTSGIVQRLSNKVLTGTFKNPVSNMIATGVPPMVMLGNRIIDLEGKVALLGDLSYTTMYDFVTGRQRNKRKVTGAS